MAASSSPPLAPWRDLFLEHIQTMPSPEFTLSTLRKVPLPPSPSTSSSPSSPGFTYVPRCRTCIFRGMFANLPVNPKNDAPLNPDVYDSDLPTFTTDCRMDKMAELFSSWGDGSQEAQAQPSDLRGSGGGAPIEAVWWASEPKVQWRVRGRAYVLAPDVEESRAGQQVVSTLRRRMRRKEGGGDGDEGDWSFGREITAHFGNLGPVMRGSFRNPPPGTPVALPVDGDGLGVGQRVTDLHDAVARAHFRVVVIVPDAVDRCDLSDPERGRRWLYTYLGDGGRTVPEAPGGRIIDGWEEVEVWP
ncbi:pyridoxamine 5'-phosphate oxidase-domain-containing protein [Xylariaceae sp. FL0662B]|nr:pyridoxamine 5'-phosphate oxidase-domain-containing protein [Xylariaceae sp. FL0662B]